MEPNEARWTISAASVLPGVSACGDRSHLSLPNVTTLLLIIGCNQPAVSYRCRPPTNSLGRPRREPSSPADKKHDNKHNFPRYSVLFSSHSGYLPELLMPCLSLCYLCNYILISLLSLSDGPGSAVAVGDERRQPQLLLRFAQGLPRDHHHLLGTLTINHQTSGHQHDRQRQASR